MQSYSLIEINNISEGEDCIKISNADRIKASTPNKKQPLLIIPKYTEDEPKFLVSSF